MQQSYPTIFVAGEKLLMAMAKSAWLIVAEIEQRLL